MDLSATDAPRRACREALCSKQCVHVCNGDSWLFWHLDVLTVRHSYKEPGTGSPSLVNQQGYPAEPSPPVTGECLESATCWKPGAL